jgi:hypothetical protein
VEAGQRVTFDGTGSTDPDTPAEELTHTWDFGDGGQRKDATGARVTHTYGRPGTYTAVLTVTDPQGGTDTDEVVVTVGSRRMEQAATARHTVVGCESDRVGRSGSWRVVRGRGPGGEHCDTRGRSTGRDRVALAFRGGHLDVWYGRARRGGTGVLLLDGRRVGTVRFGGGDTRRPRWGHHRVLTGLGAGRHEVQLVVRRGTGWLEGFGVARRRRG